MGRIRQSLGLVVESLVVMVGVKLKFQYPPVVLGESRVLLDLIMVSAPILLRRLQTVHPSLLMTLTCGLVPLLL